MKEKMKVNVVVDGKQIVPTLNELLETHQKLIERRRNHFLYFMAKFVEFDYWLKLIERVATDGLPESLVCYPEDVANYIGLCSMFSIKVVDTWQVEKNTAAFLWRSEVVIPVDKAMYDDPYSYAYNQRWSWILRQG